MTDMELRDRLIRLETIVGDETRGVLSELRGLRQGMEDLKAFQFKLAGAGAAVAVIWQLVSKALIH